MRDKPLRAFPCGPASCTGCSGTSRIGSIYRFLKVVREAVEVGNAQTGINRNRRRVSQERLDLKLQQKNEKNE